MSYFLFRSVADKNSLVALVLIENDLAEKQFETTVLTFFLLSKVWSPCVYSVNTPHPQSPQTRATDRSEAP